MTKGLDMIKNIVEKYFGNNGKSEVNSHARDNR